jgi:hypothetical protein
MNTSAELQRFLADHAEAKSAARLLSAAGPVLDAAALATAARDRGYTLTEAEAALAVESLKVVLTDVSEDQLDRVTGGVPKIRNIHYRFD